MNQSDHQSAPDIDDLSQQIDALLEEVEQASAELGEQLGASETGSSQDADSDEPAPESDRLENALADDADSDAAIELGEDKPGSENEPPETPEPVKPTPAEPEASTPELENAVDEMLSSSEDSDGDEDADQDDESEPDATAPPEDDARASERPEPDEEQEHERDEEQNDAATDESAGTSTPQPEASDDDPAADSAPIPDTSHPESEDAFCELEAELAGIAADMMEGELTSATGDRLGTTTTTQDPPPDQPDSMAASADRAEPDSGNSSAAPPDGATSGEGSLIDRARPVLGRTHRLAMRSWTGARLATRAATPRLRRGAEIMSRPLANRPQIVRQTVGWFALWTLFIAACVWATLAFFRVPPAPAGAVPNAPTLENPSGSASDDP